MTHVIESPRVADAELLGPLELASWLETYPWPDAGIDEEWIRAQRGDAATEVGIGRWRAFLQGVEAEPERWFCRVARADAGPVGFLCGGRDGVVTLGPMYLLAGAQQQGLGGQLMAEFLAWAGGAPIKLWVAEYNERAIGFYRRYGFRPTGERELWRGRLPNLRMVRETARS
ncbi:GNAT family N-acetyltransferase [Kitasatospora sp. NPDC051984]|uniref:GNAT family N-acetyltransferase n=1 Tax=Kitasatospora sp. NPDC051984 TaxID=3364059 RepID=UPI0037C7E7D2